jgi:hypothetical protein
VTAEQRKYVERARKHGANYAWTLVKVAVEEGVQISLAFAICEQETGFRNVFGHDPTIFAGAGKVTKAKYLAYKQQRGPTGRGGMQGVGPMQLTYYSFQDDADKLGGCWKVEPNIRVALRLLKSNIRQHGRHTGIARYNGTGAAAERYARSVEALQQKWHRVLVG